MANLKLSSIEVKGTKREDLLTALTMLGNIDSDFNGDNGESHL